MRKTGIGRMNVSATRTIASATKPAAHVHAEARGPLAIEQVCGRDGRRHFGPGWHWLVHSDRSVAGRDKYLSEGQRG